MITKEDLKKNYNLLQHPEGGWYARIYTQKEGAFSSIVYLLESGDFSTFHRIQQEEQWHFYFGDKIKIHEIDKNGNYTLTVLSTAILAQYVVEAGNWFAVETEGEKGFSFCGCIVVPEFRFETFEMAERKTLSEAFPQHKDIITKFTR